MSIAAASCVSAAWLVMGANCVTRTKPLSDATFLVPAADVVSTNANGEGNELLLARASDGFDAARVEVEIDGRPASARWRGDELAVSTTGLSPGVHHLAAGIEHRGGLRRFTSVAVTVGASVPVARTYARALRVVLPASLLDDGDPATHTDLVGAVKAAVARQLEAGAREAGLGSILWFEMGLRLGDVDNVFTLEGEVEFEQGAVALSTELTLRRVDDRALAIRRGRTAVVIDDRLRSWASGRGGIMAGAGAAFAGFGPLGILLAAAAGSAAGEDRAEQEAQEKVGQTIDRAIRTINGQLQLPETISVAGLPEDTILTPAFNGHPIVSDIDGVVLVLDVTVASPSDVVAPPISDPDDGSDTAPVHLDDRAHLQVSTALLAGMMPLVASPRVLDEALDAVVLRHPHGLPLRPTRIRSLTGALPSGIDAAGLPWALPAVEVTLDDGARAVAFLSGGLAVSVSPDRTSLLVQPVPTFLRIGCRDAAATSWRVRPCLDVIGTVAPELPRRLAEQVQPVEVLTDMLQTLRTLPLDGTGRMNLSAELVQAGTSAVRAYAVELEFDVRVETPRRPERAPRRGARRGTRR